ncbi:hypothetical protein Q4488_10375 [Amphritea sp. 1_MG-2023]|nr:hypothetical protein [Amphritea sp. 1_MG-2023]MDO6563787.1 hypothetical protein [Amphritea sp. 1_MG-2023]
MKWYLCGWGLWNKVARLGAHTTNLTLAALNMTLEKASSSTG